MSAAAVQLKHLTQKDETKAEARIEHIAQLPEGDKVSKKHVDYALRSQRAARQGQEREHYSAAGRSCSAAARSRITPDKVRLVAEILGISEDDEEQILERVIDEFLALKRR